MQYGDDRTNDEPLRLDPPGESARGVAFNVSGAARIRVVLVEPQAVARALRRLPPRAETSRNTDGSMFIIQAKPRERSATATPPRLRLR
jgi:hypothetical protein